MGIDLNFWYAKFSDSERFISKMARFPKYFFIKNIFQFHIQGDFGFFFFSKFANNFVKIVHFGENEANSDSKINFMFMNFES